MIQNSSGIMGSSPHLVRHVPPALPPSCPHSRTTPCAGTTPAGPDQHIPNASESYD